MTEPKEIEYISLQTFDFEYVNKLREEMLRETYLASVIDTLDKPKESDET